MSSDITWLHALVAWLDHHFLPPLGTASDPVPAQRGCVDPRRIMPGAYTIGRLAAVRRIAK